MTITSLKQVLVLPMMLFIASPALGTGSMRCSGRLVDQGMTKDEVIQVCGPPTTGKEDDNYWYYDRGSSILVTRLFFVGDKVEFIDDVAREDI